MKVEKFIPKDNEDLLTLVELERLGNTSFEDFDTAREQWETKPPYAKYQSILQANIETGENNETT